MDTWEYKQALTTELGGLGKEGWEAYGAVYAQSYNLEPYRESVTGEVIIHLLKRKVPPPQGFFPV